MKKIVIYTDGGSRGNPGKAAIGVVFCNEIGQEIKKFGEYLGDGLTNNEAEYQGVILALENLLQNLDQYQIYTDIDFTLDSELVVKQLTGVYRIKKPELQTLTSNIHQLIHQLPQHVTFRNVLRHLNKLPDALLNQELDLHK